MNYDEMRGKQGANMLNHVTTMVGQEQFCFFALLINNFSYRGNVKGPISRDSEGLSVQYTSLHLTLVTLLCLLTLCFIYTPLSLHTLLSFPIPTLLSFPTLCYLPLTSHLY